MICDRLRAFGTSIFAEMTALARERGAINLAQGFPDFEGSPAILEAAVQALRSGDNQYARSRGQPRLVEAVAGERGRRLGLEYSPADEVCVFSGATEGIAAALLGLLNPGDEVVLFEPFYDSYPACIALAGARARVVTLRAPGFRIEAEALRAAVGPRTRAVLLNTPHNPTGRVFDEEELDVVAEVCRERDLALISDEVYEHILHDGRRHLSPAALPGMRERTLAISSAGKTFSFTGWKVGWATGPAALIDAAAAAHQFLVFSTATPLQAAVASALEAADEAFASELRGEYGRRRDLLVSTLAANGFRPMVPEGSYFVLAEFAPVLAGDDRAAALELIDRAGVAALPPSSFWSAEPAQGRRLLRFAFCKRLETLEAAAANMERGLGR